MKKFFGAVWVSLGLAMSLVAEAIPQDVVGAKLSGVIGPDGVTELECDLPFEFIMSNKAGRDGAGLCVFTSISHSARWQGVVALEDFRDWMLTKTGGGWPQRVEKLIPEIAKEKGMPTPDFLQVEGPDVEILKLACKTGRMPAVTYSFSPSGRYSGQKIAHMVSLAGANDKYFVINDNNYIPTLKNPNNYEWLTPEEFKRVYLPGWSVILLQTGPPPVPRN